MKGETVADRIVAAARDLVGVPFRLHGRSAEQGVDCVGLAAMALGRAGHCGQAPRGYGLRSGDEARARGWLGEAGLRPVEAPRPGDLALVRPGPLQLHLMIVAQGGHVHAHAGLGRVVEMPGPSPWPVIGHWRTEEEETWQHSC
ncbi:MAG TPA: peptidoglycan endopeptidase [Sphingobium sp.]|nr:peptidoglycan endopeptidase [Sphingobium sp.]